MTVSATVPSADRDDAPRGPEQLRAPYLEAVTAYAQRNPLRLYVPGHDAGAGADPALVAALGAAPFKLDVPRDIDGVDVGTPPSPYDQAEALAASAYGAARTWFLTNGATQGNHALCLALAPSGTAVLVQRNCHGSTIDGLVLSGGSPTYLWPGYDEGLGIGTVVTPDRLRRALRDRPDVRAAFLVSPTYFGMVLDVAGCAQVAHEAGVTLVVDCAWGPHFGFHPALPMSPLAAGADAVLTSTHKHAGSLTQSAMLHAAHGREDLVCSLERAVGLVRSTSLSALLLASLDAARRQLVVRGTRVLGDAVAVAEHLRDRVEEVPGCRVLDRSWRGAEVHAWDPLRVVVDVRETGIPATALTARLRDVHDVHLELCTHTSLVLVVPLGMRMAEADDAGVALREAVAASPRAPLPASPPLSLPEADRPQLTPREAFLGATETVAREHALGRLSAEAISAYPPGIPTLLPGEPITAAALELLLSLGAAGVRLQGASDPELRTLVVTKAP
jgi:arginine decarboxylase